MYRLIILCTLILASVAPVWSQPASTPACDLPPDLTAPSTPLARVAAMVNTKRQLDILALGSGSTVGESGGSGGPALNVHTPERSFPYRMIEVLRAMKPDVQFNLTVTGGRGMTADSMLPILRQELAAHHYDLILWQTGTVEAVQGSRPDALHTVLQDGAALAEEAHADLVLIDPQFSRFLRANADLAPYETVLTQITAAAGVTLFHRFDLTQTWVNNGQVDLERVGRDQRDKTIELLNDCLGQALARYVLTGSTEH